MKNEPLFDDDAEEYLETNKKKQSKKSEEEILDEEIYKRRCKLVSLSRNDYYKFKQYLLDNESFFKSKMAQADKECMRRTCQNAWDKSTYSEIGDTEIFDRIFGKYVNPHKSETIPLYDSRERKMVKMTIEEEIDFRSKGSYYAMWDFISNPEWQEKLKGREDLYDKVKSMIDRAKENNDCVKRFVFKEYEQSDEEMYVKVLGLMKNEQND